MRVATAAWQIDWLDDWQAYADKLEGAISEAACNEADLLVFPEYGAMELASLFGQKVALDLHRQIDVISDLVPQIDQLHADLARRYQVYLLAASLPLRLKSAEAVNRARFFGPEGYIGKQDKVMMTRFEREQWFISGGNQLRVFDTPIGCFGVVMCYDSEFPLLSRALVEAGANVLLVPSCTDSVAGYWRVRIGAMARALESQCYVVHSPTVGLAEWSASVDENVGAAAVYAPPDLGFPETGVVAEGGLNQPGWVYADLDISRVDHVRKSGQVLNHGHWPEQLVCLDQVVKN